MSDVSDRWSRVQTLFEQACDRPADERTAWLRSVCGDDPEVYDHVAAMLYGEANQHAIFGGRAIDLIPPASGGDTIVPSRAGERVGPWVLGDRVGTGGMGAVYHAERDGDFGQTVALKRVKRGMDSEAVLTRFRAERRILARLEHPGIARLLDGGLDADGRPYFAMEYVDGEPITASCDTRRLGVDERLRLFEGVCEAVAYAHRSLVVHRDLKPSNVLVTEAGEVKLLDFGIARVLSDDTEADLTRTGQRVFTPGYAAPEQVRGEAPTTSTDVYALGVLLYGLLSGAKPIETADRSPTEVERAVLDETPRRPSAAVDAEAARARGTTASALADRLAGDLDTITFKALEKEPERRYGSAAELLADIRRHREGFPIEARPATRGYRAGLFVRRHRGAVAAAAVALAAVVGGAGVALWQAAEARNQRDRAEVEAQTAEEVTAFISSLLYSASPQNLQSPDAANVRDLRVADLLAQGAERVETELEGQPAVQVRLFDVIGEAYRALGDYDRAAELLERAYEVSQDQTLDSDLRAMAASNLGMLRMDAGDLDAAESLKRESFAILQSAGLLGGIGEGVVLNDLAMILSYKGQYADAEPIARRALDLFLRLYGPDNPMVGNVSNTLAGVQLNLGDLDAAEQTYRANLERRRAAEPEGGDATATALGLLGNMLVESRGDPDAGEPFLREALEMRRRVLGDEHPYVAISLNELAGARLAQGQLDDAVDLYSQALALRRKVLDPGHPHLAYSLVGYGRAQLEADRPEQAESLFREAIEVREAALPAGHELTLETRSWLGASLAAQGRQSEGEAILRNAYQELLDTRGPEARRTQEARERLDALGA